MSKETELYNAIASFIEKYWRDERKVKKPACQFVIKGIGQVKIDSNSLIERSDTLYTFEGSAVVSYTDISKVVTNKNLSFIGNATVVFYPNGVNTKEMLPEIQEVVITKVNYEKH